MVHLQQIGQVDLLQREDLFRYGDPRVSGIALCLILSSWTGYVFIPPTALCRSSERGCALKQRCDVLSRDEPLLFHAWRLGLNFSKLYRWSNSQNTSIIKSLSQFSAILHRIMAISPWSASPGRFILQSGDWVFLINGFHYNGFWIPWYFLDL